MNQVSLTKAQIRVLDVIQQSIRDEGRPPTRAEIANALGFRSINSAESHLRALEQWADYLSCVLGDESLEMAKRLHLEQWWQLYGNRWPNLQPVMIKVFSAGCVANPCERNWSEWKFVSQQRHSLGNSIGEKLVYNYSNLKVLAREAGAVASPRPLTVKWGYMRS